MDIKEKAVNSVWSVWVASAAIMEQVIELYWLCDASA